jgi:protein arginine kinase activator
MLCDACKQNPPTVFLTQIVDGKMQKVNLCEQCSKEKGVTDPTSFAFLDLLQGLGTAQVLDKSQANLRCPVCGFSQGDFKKTGRLGCSACYEVFEDNITALIKTIHRGSKHTGKFPPKAVHARDYKIQIDSLQGELRNAVASENYEIAASIRDMIRKLESQTTGAE